VFLTESTSTWPALDDSWLHKTKNTEVIPNLQRNCQKGGTGQDSFSGLFSCFSQLTRKGFRKVVGETAGPCDGILPKVWNSTVRAQTWRTACCILNWLWGISRFFQSLQEPSSQV
jgi:hypothetical protein